MIYTFEPSLQHITLVKIVTTLWNRDDIRRALIANIYYPLLEDDSRRKWPNIEDKIVETVLQLSQPQSLKMKILSFIKPIGSQILQWMEYHNSCLGIDIPNDLFWTSKGTIDKKKTAEMLIKDKNLCITKRYKLACIYCLEDEARDLWHLIPLWKKADFYNDAYPADDNIWLVKFWTYDIEGLLPMLNDWMKKIKGKDILPYQFAFECSAVFGNKPATEYFLKKLTFWETEKLIIKVTGKVAKRFYSNMEIVFPAESYTDILCFLLSQMDEKQQREVFKSYSYQVLCSLLDWPWQSLFMETANRMWDFLDGELCDEVLTKFVDKMMLRRRDFDYKNLFREFWQKIPNVPKRYIIDGCASGSLLTKLLELEDKESISLILQDATFAEREIIIFCGEGKNICLNLIYRGKWELLKVFVEGRISSKNLLIKFKEEFKERIISCRSEATLEREKIMWSVFFQILDDLSHKDNKNNCLEKNSSPPAKRRR